MPDKSEKERRKQINNDLRKKAREEFESSLPMDRDFFKNLFYYLDIELGEKGCDHTQILTRTFLLKHGIAEAGTILSWLADEGGYCDCEILANVEPQFDSNYV